MSLTVLIPSYKRAEYLKTAIESVIQQTVFKDIDRILVSENSDDLESKQVCKQFNNPKIDFVQQKKPLSSIDHACWIIEQSNSAYTAMLHDDDWWYPTHIEYALDALKKEDIKGYFSNFIFANNEIISGGLFHYPNVISLFANNISIFKHVELSFSDICCMCYLFTPFHMSSMVIKTNILKEASDFGLKFAKPWYADRIIYPYICFRGKVIFNPQILVGVRMHSSNDAKTIDKNERYDAHIEGSLKIKNLANSEGIDIIKRWEEIKTKTTETEFQYIYSIFQEYFGDKNSTLFVEAPKPLENKPRSLQSKIKQLFHS